MFKSLMPATSRFHLSFADELVKVGARAGLKLIRNLVEGGELGKAERLALTPGVLKKTQAGSQIKQLGAGMEGASTLIAHPKKGIAVRKIYDPQGLSGPEMIARKADVGRQLNDSPDVAKFLGESPTRIGPAHLSEYVPGKSLHDQGVALGTPKPATPQSPLDLSTQAGAQIKRLKQRGERMGIQMADLHEGNVVAQPGKKKVTLGRGPTGKLEGKVTYEPGHTKAVDYLPLERGKSTGLNSDAVERAMGVRQAQMEGKSNAYENYLHDPRRPGNLMARAYRGAPPLPPGSSPQVPYDK